MPADTIEERFAMIGRHFKDLIAFKGEQVAVREMRHHATAYIKGLPHAAAYKNKLNIAVKNFSASRMKTIGDKTGVRIGLLDGPWFLNKRQAIDGRFIENFHFDFYCSLGYQVK